MYSENGNADMSIRRTAWKQGKEGPEVKTALHFVLSAAIVLSCFLFCKYTGKLYIDVDNYYVAMVTAGVFDDINWCYYVNPVLCILIKVLTGLIQRVDWFTMLSHILVFTGAVWLVFSALTWKAGKLLEKTVFILWIVFLLAGLNLWNINYTVQSAFFCYVGGMGLFCVRSDSRERKVLVTLFLLCGIAWRIEVFFLFLPFMILKAVCDSHIFLRKQGKIRPTAFQAGLLAACAILITAHYAVRLLPQNTEAVRYNRARTAITDYPMESWEQFPEKDLITETAYQAITTEWCFLDTEALNADLLEQVADAGGRTLSFHQALYRLARVCSQNRSSLYVPCAWLLLLGLFHPVIYFIGETNGIKYTNSSFAGIMISLIPVATALFSGVFLHEKMSKKAYAWIFCSVAGVIVISLSQAGGGAVHPVGILYLCLAIFAGAMFYVFSRSISGVFTPFERTFISMLMGFIFYASVGLVQEGSGFVQVFTEAATDRYVLLPVLFLSVISSVIAFMLQNYSVTHLDAAKVTVFSNMVP